MRLMRFSASSAHRVPVRNQPRATKGQPRVTVNLTACQSKRDRVPAASPRVTEIEVSCNVLLKSSTGTRFVLLLPRLEHDQNLLA